MEDKKRPAPRQELRERIVATAMMAFTAHGIRSIRMDDIATQMGISKRTLYEIFADKETLLKECIQVINRESYAVLVLSGLLCFRCLYRRHVLQSIAE